MRDDWLLPRPATLTGLVATGASHCQAPELRDHVHGGSANWLMKRYGQPAPQGTARQLNRDSSSSSTAAGCR